MHHRATENATNHDFFGSLCISVVALFPSPRSPQLIGCHYRKVDKNRKIRRDGIPQIQKDVKNDRISINKAYKLIRDRELGEDEEKCRRKLSAAQIKAAKALLADEHLRALNELGGDLTSHINRAVEEYLLRWLESESNDEPGYSDGTTDQYGGAHDDGKGQA
jgi:hypothetical protein